MLSKRNTLLRWVLVYLWSVPAVMLLGRTMNWQYDGDIGFWIVLAYTAPVLYLLSPLLAFFTEYTIWAAYGVALLILTIIAVRATRLTDDNLIES
jgi:FtsH-binding integral membrane protein